MLKGRHQGIFLGQVVVSQEVYDDFSVGGGMENMAMPFIDVTKQRRVDKVAVMANSDLASDILFQQRLGVGRTAGSGGGISIVTNRRDTFEPIENPRWKNFGNQSHARVGLQRAPVTDRNPRRLLPTMLLGIQSCIGQVNTLRRTPYSEYAAFILLFFIHNAQRPAW